MRKNLNDMYFVIVSNTSMQNSETNILEITGLSSLLNWLAGCGQKMIRTN